MSLGEVWKTRCERWDAGHAAFKAAAKELDAQRGSTALWLKASLWYMANDAIVEGNEEKARAMRSKQEADKLWHDAILAEKGNIKILWEYVAEKDSFRCLFETGEVFEP